MKSLKSISSMLGCLMVYFIISTPVAVVTISPVEAAECTLYETLHPNYVLTGSHLSTGKCSTCASCHAGGVFLGTPKVCATCHNGSPTSPTVGRSSNHFAIGSIDCDSCHNTTSFTASWQMTHAKVTGFACSSCHNGSYTAYGAIGQHPTHIPTISECNTCHTSKDNPTHTSADWTVSIEKIHVGVTTGCVTCHNGVSATGKSSYKVGHPVTSDACETCHSISNNFKCTWLDNFIGYVKELFA